MNRAVRAAALATLLVPLAASAQPLPPAAPDPANLRGESTQTRKRLAEAEQKLLAGKAADAADDLQRVLDESTDDLITLDGKHYQPARRVAHQLLSRLPAEALKAYRDRIDQPAKKLLDQARRDRDPRPLWQLLDRYFVSEPADEAILLLGDLLFERGEFRAAEGVWRQLLPDGGADVTYPGSKTDPALARARVVLAAAFQRDADRAKAELAAFKEKHPDAKGTLAGKTGPLADTLQAFLRSAPELPPDAAAGADWPTYGGAPDRAGRVPGGIPRYWPSQPSWTAAIPPDPGLIRHGPLNPPGRPPFAHPVILNGEVFVADGTRVFGFDLRTGKRTRSYSPPKLNVPPGGRVGDACCTLSASGGRLYARLGPSVVRAPETQAGGKMSEESVLVCLDPRPKELKELWRLSPPEEKASVAWEGAPVASGRRLWAVYTKFEGGRTVHVAACYDPADGDTIPGRPAWTAELCDSPLPVAGEGRTRQELLTLAGRHLVFCSNGGAVVAVDAVTGRPAWGFRYPRSRKAASATAGDPAPAVAFGGRVFVAPADGERVYALDAETGRLVWESGPTEGARILGVARNRLIVTVAGPVRGIRGLHLDTGSHRPDAGGWVQHQGDGLLSYGQGLVTEDVVVWPSRRGLHFLDPRGGYPLARPFFAPYPNVLQNYFGHLAYADGVLVVVTPLQVWGFVAESRKVVPRPDAPPRERFETMIDDAERKFASGDAPAARAALAATAASDLPPAFRAWAAARLVQLTPLDAANQLPAEVRAVLQPALLNEWVLAPDGVPVTLDTFVRRRLGNPPAPGSTPVTAARPECEACAPGLNAESDFERMLKLPAGVVPLRAIPGVTGAPRRLFAAGPRRMVAVPLDGGAESEHAAADLFTHAADLRDGFVAAGPFAVAVYGAGREPAWVFRVPLTDRLPEGVYGFRLRCDREPAVPHLSSFVLAGPWVLARVGEHHLIALDLLARRVAWVLCATGRAGFDPKLFPTAPRFGPHFAVVGSTVVAQLSDGRRWFVKLRTGRPAQSPALGERTARVGWAQPPARLGPNLLAVSDGPGLVRLLQFGGRVKWAYEAEFEEGLAGEPPQVRAWGDVLVVAVRRNHGVEFERVGLGDGKPAWSRGPAFADADRIDLSAADADAERLYVPAGDRLLAVALGNGKAAWKADLPDTRGAGGWVVRAGRTCVIAYPTSAIPREPTRTVFERLARSFRREPLVWRLPGLAGTLYDAWVDRAVPVLVFDPETGKRLGRFDIPARGPAVSAHLDADAAVFATGDRVVWIK